MTVLSNTHQPRPEPTGTRLDGLSLEGFSFSDEYRRELGEEVQLEDPLPAESISHIRSFWERQAERHPELKNMVADVYQHNPVEHVRSLNVQANLSLTEILLVLSCSEAGRDFVDHMLPLISSQVRSSFRDWSFSLRDLDSKSTVSTLFQRAQGYDEFTALLQQANFGNTLFWFLSGLREKDRPNMEVRELIKDKVQMSELRLLSYNVWGMPRLLGGRSFGRFAAIADELVRIDADVVALQEMWVKDTSKVNRLGHYGFEARSPNTHGILGANGLSFLSKFPIVESNVFQFSTRRSVERFVRKGGMHIRVRTPDGGEKDFWNFHHASTSCAMPHSTAQAQRDQEYKQARAWIDSVRTPGVPIYVLGDLNTDEHVSQAYSSLREVYGVDLYRRRHPQAASTENDQRQGITFNPIDNPYARSPSQMPERLDYIFRRDHHMQTALGARIEMDRNIYRQAPGSDHYAVFAQELQFSE